MYSYVYYICLCLRARSGHAAYGQAVKLINDSSSLQYRIGATQFMFYHTVTRTSADFIAAYKSALDISVNITNTLRAAFPGSNYRVFPYRYATAFVLHCTALYCTVGCEPSASKQRNETAVLVLVHMRVCVCVCAASSTCSTTSTCTSSTTRS